MSVKSRLAAATVLTAAVAAVAYPTAGAFAADTAHRDTRPGTPATSHQVQLPDGSRARLTSGRSGTTVTVTSARGHHTLDAGRPSADLDRLHLRIIGGDTTHPTLRARLDGTRLTNYYDFASGSLRHTADGSDLDRPVREGDSIADYRKESPAGPAATAVPAQPRPHGAPASAQPHASAKGKPPHDSSGNPVKRVVEAGQVIKASHDVGDVGTPVLAAGVALLAVGGAYGVRVALRRGGRGES
ncbi:hypothetical protein BLA24_00390 [Streptomyces cinnamoneus]|uniref:Uncharacterized protein n=1 Tax=Streptomyces cinnamoneus TaxID=53446 RepID=A0A2G1XQB4_STRCJ|nr:hypothetical protein [Streptomyces cinnamoneus]PHQ53428.1 hypothetical protein BLA24_00390 [Streptomyces cinnamoneus]PPT12732.1 hypothetical protein CYQ11_07400 [Streptomyces cinnamoneus]